MLLKLPILLKLLRYIFKKPFHQYKVNEKVHAKLPMKVGKATIIGRAAYSAEYCIKFDVDVKNGRDIDYWIKETKLKKLR